MIGKKDYEFRSIAAAPAVGSHPGGKNKLPIISGYAAVFNSLSEPMKQGGTEFREIIRPGAFLRSIADAAQGIIDVVGRFDHLGILGRTSNRTVRLREDDHGLRYEIDTPDTTDGRDLLELIRRGDVRGSSFGFKDAKSKVRRDVTGLLREITDLRLIDVSPVTFAAYSATSVRVWDTGQLGRMQMRLQLAEATQ